MTTALERYNPLSDREIVDILMEHMKKGDDQATNLLADYMNAKDWEELDISICKMENYAREALTKNILS